MIKLGDKIMQKIEFGAEGGKLLPPQPGTVVYVHPRGWFYTLEFTFERFGVKKTLRESYCTHGIQGDESALMNYGARGKTQPIQHEKKSNYLPNRMAYGGLMDARKKRK